MKAKLGDIFNITSGGTPLKSHKEYFGGNIPWVKTGDLKEQYLQCVDGSITELGLQNSAAKIYEPGTVLLAMYGATIGASSILKIPASTNQACAAFVKNENILPEYLYYFFVSHREKFIHDGVGGAQPNISIGYLKQVSMDVPAMDVQRQIVGIFGRVSSMITNIQCEIEKLDTLVKSRFIEMFGDLRINPYKWDIQTFEMLTDLITDGEHATPRRAKQGIYLISARNILNHSIQLDDVDYIDEEEYNRIARRITPRKGDVLISCSGSVGRCCSVPAGLKFQMVRSVALLRFKPYINPVFAEYLITSDYLQGQINSSKTASSQANLFQGKIAKLKGIAPPLDLQNQFADFVEQVDKAKAVLQKLLEKQELLRAALMQEYFG